MRHMFFASSTKSYQFVETNSCECDFTFLTPRLFLSRNKLSEGSIINNKTAYQRPANYLLEDREFVREKYLLLGVWEFTLGDSSLLTIKI